MYAVFYRPSRKAEWVLVGEGTHSECVGMIDGRGGKHSEWWISKAKAEPAGVFAGEANGTAADADVAQQPDRL